MITLAIDTSAAGAFSKEWQAEDWHKKALRRAVQAETFSLYNYTKWKLNVGTDWPQRAALTKVMAKRRGNTALKAWAPMLAYYVPKEQGNGAVGYIGWALGAFRRKRIPLGWIKQTLAGGSFDFPDDGPKGKGRKLQAEIATHIRQRFPGITRQRLRMMIPKLGRRIVMPEREVLEIITVQQAAVTQRNIEYLYWRALHGERWAKKWMVMR